MDRSQIGKYICDILAVARLGKNRYAADQSAVCLLPYCADIRIPCPPISRQSEVGSRRFQLTGKNLLKLLPRSTRNDSSQALPRQALAAHGGCCLRLCPNTVTFRMQFFGKAASPPVAKPNLHSVMRCKVVTE